jgi:hypothetical protein
MPLPVVTITQSSPLICEADTFSLMASGAPQWMWNTGDTTALVSTTLTAGNYIYTATGTGSAGCSATQSISVSVLALPNVQLTASVPDICLGEQITLMATGAATYVWEPGAMTGSSITTAPQSSTMYTVTGLGQNGCAGSALIPVVVNACTSVSKRNGENNITIFPNPAGDRFFLATGSSGKLVTIRLYDDGGKLVHLQNTSSAVTEINVSRLAQGLYQVLITLDGEVIYVQKLIRE